MGSDQSRCTLEEIFLTKPQNYTMQVSHFVVSITPQINSVTDPYFEVLARPGVGVANAFIPRPDVLHADFNPDNPKCVLEVFRELQAFVDLHDGLTVTLEENYEINFVFTADFGTARYLKFNTTIATLLGVPEYLYFFRSSVADGGAIRTADLTQQYPDLFLTPNEAVGLGLQATANYYFRTSQAFPLGADPHRYTTANINALDTRMSLDITSTIGVDSKNMVLNGVERIRKLIGRFSLREANKTFSERGSDGSVTLSEYVNVGLEDLTRGNPNTQTANLQTGEVYVVNTFIETRYLENRGIFIIPTVFDPSGFFYLELLFTKRLK
jgi:hypothetical protein